jgi:hypothetical protein
MASDASVTAASEVVRQARGDYRDISSGIVANRQRRSLPCTHLVMALTTALQLPIVA